MGTLKESVLTPALDAQAANDYEARLLNAPHTPEADSLREVLTEGLRTTCVIASRAITAAIELLDKVEELNAAERDCERTIAGYADQQASSEHAERLEGGGFNAKRLCRKLGLRDLIDSWSAHISLTRDRDAQLLTMIVEGYGLQKLTSGQCAYELGARRVELLNEFVVRERVAA